MGGAGGSVMLEGHGGAVEDLFWGPGQVGVRFWEKGRDGRGQNSLFPILSPTPVAFNKQKATVYSTNMYKEILPPSRGALEDRGTGLRPPPFFWGAGVLPWQRVETRAATTLGTLGPPAFDTSLPLVKKAWGQDRQL